MDGRLSVVLPEVFGAGAQWSGSAATFADVVPPVIASAWPSAAAVGEIHAEVTLAHAAFGTRLLKTGIAAQLAGTAYSVMDAEQNAQALGEVIGNAVQA